MFFKKGVLHSKKRDPVPSSAKRIATQILATAKLNERKEFIMRGGFVYDILRPIKKLPVQSKRLKHKNKV